MGHGLNKADQARLVLRKDAAWHGYGNIIQDDLTAVQAGERFGLFDDVDSWTLSATNAGSALDALGAAINSGDMIAAFAAFREYKSKTVTVGSHRANIMVTKKDGLDTHEIMGVVGKSYRVCQNRELAEFTDALSQSGQVVVETAGTIQGGKKVWFLARGESFDVGGTDKVYPYILVSNAHDGSASIRVSPTSIRTVCKNTLSLVIPVDAGEGVRFDSSAFSMQHTGDLMSKLDAAKYALRTYGSVLEKNRGLYEEMQSRQVSKDQAMGYFANQYVSWDYQVPTNADLNSDDKKVRQLAERRKAKMDQAAKDFLARWESEKESAGGENSWLLANALSGVLQHDMATRGKDDAARIENRMKSNLFGLNEQRTVKAFEAAMNLAI